MNDELARNTKLKNFNTVILIIFYPTPINNQVFILFIFVCIKVYVYLLQNLASEIKMLVVKNR